MSGLNERDTEETIPLLDATKRATALHRVLLVELAKPENTQTLDRLIDGLYAIAEEGARRSRGLPHPRMLERTE